jgi:hypothetical protein
MLRLGPFASLAGWHGFCWHFSAGEKIYRKTKKIVDKLKI